MTEEDTVAHTWPAARKYFGLDESFQYSAEDIERHVCSFQAAMTRTNLDLALAGAYIGIGVIYGAPDGMLETWAQGQIELVSSACQYAEYINALAAAAYEVTTDYPGMFEYDVTELFGTWYRDSMILRHGQEPSPQMCRVYLLNEVQHFFASTELEEALFEAVGEAIMRVPFGFGEE